MSSDFHTIGHPGDVGIEARADTLGELMQTLAEGIADELFFREHMQVLRELPIEVEAKDAPALLGVFLEQVVRAIRDKHFLPRQVLIQDVSETSCKAFLQGESFDPDRHESVRAVQGLRAVHEVRSDNGSGWYARVSLEL